jgi:hypothetical protein
VVRGYPTLPPERPENEGVVDLCSITDGITKSASERFE